MQPDLESRITIWEYRKGVRTSIFLDRQYQDEPVPATVSNLVFPLDIMRGIEQFSPGSGYRPSKKEIRGGSVRYEEIADVSGYSHVTVRIPGRPSSLYRQRLPMRIPWYHKDTPFSSTCFLSQPPVQLAVTSVVSLNQAFPYVVKQSSSFTYMMDPTLPTVVLDRQGIEGDGPVKILDPLFVDRLVEGFGQPLGDEFIEPIARAAEYQRTVPLLPGAAEAIMFILWATYSEQDTSAPVFGGRCIFYLPRRNSVVIPLDMMDTHNPYNFRILQYVSRHLAKYQSTRPRSVAADQMRPQLLSITVGADPEFEYVVGDKVVDLADNRSLPFKASVNTPIGVDGSRHQVELRPEPSTEPERFVDNVRSLMHILKRAGCDLRCTGNTFPLGGHLHFGITYQIGEDTLLFRKTNGNLIRALDYYIGGLTTGMNGSRRGGYNQRRSVRSQSHGIEYRTPPSAVFADPELTTIIVRLGYAVIKGFFAGTITVGKTSDTPEVILGRIGRTRLLAPVDIKCLGELIINNSGQLLHRNVVGFWSTEQPAPRPSYSVYTALDVLRIPAHDAVEIVSRIEHQILIGIDDDWIAAGIAESPCFGSLLRRGPEITNVMTSVINPMIGYLREHRPVRFCRTVILTMEDNDQEEDAVSITITTPQRWERYTLSFDPPVIAMLPDIYMVLRAQPSIAGATGDNDHPTVADTTYHIQIPTMHSSEMALLLIACVAILDTKEVPCP